MQMPKVLDILVSSFAPSVSFEASLDMTAIQYPYYVNEMLLFGLTLYSYIIWVQKYTQYFIVFNYLYCSAAEKGKNFVWNGIL